MRGLRHLSESPCNDHPCDLCRLCRGGRCCRGDDPQYELPTTGDWQPIFGEIGVINEVGDRQECHACGLWFESLGRHGWLAHDLTAAEYRALFGLKWGQALAGQRVRDKARRTLSQFNVRDAAYLAGISPSRERKSMVSSRPERDQVLKQNAARRAKFGAAAKGTQTPRTPNMVNCGTCGISIRRPPSGVARVRANYCSPCARRHRIDRLSKLTPDDVGQIRLRLQSGSYQHVIAEEFGVSRSLIGQIKNGLIHLDT